MFFASTNAFSQKFEFFKGLTIDSNYIILGQGQGYDKTADSLERFWFILDKPEDIMQFRKDFKLGKKASHVDFGDKNLIDINIIKNKKQVGVEGVFYPFQEKFASNGKGWYELDTSLLAKLHNEHPLKYHTQKFLFDNYAEYNFFVDSIETVPSFLYMDEPKLQYEGKFTVIVDRDPETSNPLFLEIDLKKEIALLLPENKFHVYTVINDKFNTESKTKVKITVEGPKTLYDRYSNSKNIKGEWEKNLIDPKVYFSD
ncbi:MAG: hypothetical protein QM726_03695 [Chitinophagaceae bacterium]